jgi:hypothetical protein
MTQFCTEKQQPTVSVKNIEYALLGTFSSFQGREDGGSIFVRNNGIYLKYCTVSTQKATV